MSPYLAVSVLAIMLASLSGAFFASRLFSAWITPRLRYFVALAAGVFVVNIYQLIHESLHGGFTYGVVGAFVLGAVLLEGVTRLLPKETHHHHGVHPEHRHGAIDARRMLVGDAVHNFHDGLALTPMFFVSPILGLGAAAGVLLHEVVQEIAEFFVLREAGYSVHKALWLNLLVSTTTVLGVGLALMLVSFEELLRSLVAFSAGSFTYIVARDLLPSIIYHAAHEQRYVRYAAAMLAGIILMSGISVLAPHVHEAEEEFLVPEGFGIAWNS